MITKKKNLGGRPRVSEKEKIKNFMFAMKDREHDEIKEDSEKALMTKGAFFRAIFHFYRRNKKQFWEELTDDSSPTS